MVVTVKLYATLRKFYPDLGVGEGMRVELPEGATVGQLLNHLNLPPDVVRVAFVNGIARDENHPLSDGDEIGLFPPVGGG
ncbi:MAG: MoaD/ThiS family protein [Anaerolineae bacterium]|nr:MoaD/ThiS family protein [Anaerolineae bacterium]MCX8066606.1 MoaD/ThiS family protein [Anaerolineae bacterium]MDW7991356.1 MoaD/ThiS family protein [Anaerolineae bacterium]